MSICTPLGGEFMRITWFGGKVFRLYLGGQIFVTDADKVSGNASPHEVAAAADHLIDLSDNFQEFAYLEPENWGRRRRRARPIDLPEQEEIAGLYSVGGEALFIDEPEEGPLVIAPGEGTAWGAYCEGAVVVLYGKPKAVLAGVSDLLGCARPRLIALAAEPMPDDALVALEPELGDTALVVLAPGLSVEA